MQQVLLCHTHDIQQGQAKGITVGEHALFVVHYQGEFFAYRNQCPHRQIELEWMPDQFFDSAGDYIQCATHGALFLPATGRCIAGPCQNQSLIPVTIERMGDDLYTDLDAL